MKPRKHRDLIIDWANGAQIQVKSINGIWVDIDGTPLWDPRCEYRKKPEPKYRPYTYEEAKKVLGQTVISKTGNHLTIINNVGVFQGLITVNAMNVCTLLQSYTFLDGTPCGVLEE